MRSNSITLGFLFIVLIVCAIIFGPFVTIWALNTLFPVLAIEYSFMTWLAVIIIHASIRGLFVEVKK